MRGGPTEATTSPTAPDGHHSGPGVAPGPSAPAGKTRSAALPKAICLTRLPTTVRSGAPEPVPTQHLEPGIEGCSGWWSPPESRSSASPSRSSSRPSSPRRSTRSSTSPSPSTATPSKFPPALPSWEALRQALYAVDVLAIEPGVTLKIAKMMYGTPSLRARSIERHLQWHSLLASIRRRLGLKKPLHWISSKRPTLQISAITRN